MLKLLAITLLVNSSVFALTTDETVIKFLEKSFKGNPKIVALKVNIADKVAVQSMQGWSAYIVDIDATVKAEPKERQVKQKMIWFSNGQLITQDLIDLKTGDSLKDAVSPAFKKEYYKKENLIYGDADAKHKVAIFSDPLCPYCKNFVPKAIEFMKKDAKKFAIYYYHFPLSSLHPAAVQLVKAASVLQMRGYKDVVLNLYKLEIDAREKDVNKILAAFNKTFKTELKAEDLTSEAVVQNYENDMKIADEVMVQGTPTMFFDGKLDKSKRKYEKAE